MKNTIRFKVSKHPSGRYTLMRKKRGEKLYSDMRGKLLGNMDKGEFYRAVAARIAKVAAKNVIIYEDAL